jgi:hypothetical protein
VSGKIEATSRLAKFTSRNGEEWVPHDYAHVYSVEHTKGPDRLCIAVGNEGTRILLRLSEVLRDPFFVLYLLLIPRASGEGNEGRYQSPSMIRPEAVAFFQRFSRFLDEDARHHIWLHSQNDNATLIYDRHNVIFAYGPLKDYQRILAEERYSETESVSFPAPHGHNYHVEFDADERALIANEQWTRSPLRDGDEY